MIDAFLFFIAGAAAMRFLQFILGVTPNYYIFKEAEYISLSILMDLHIRRLTALKILELTYEESQKLEDFEKVKYAINQKYDALITKCIQNLKSKLPYKVQYTSLNEAAEYFIDSTKEKRNEQ